MADDLPEEFAAVLVLQVYFLLLYNFLPVGEHTTENGKLLLAAFKIIRTVEHQSLDYSEELHGGGREL